MSAVELACAFTNPNKVSTQVICSAGSRIDSRHWALVVKQKRFVTHEKLGGAKFFEVRTTGGHELDCAIDFFGEREVFGVYRVVGKTAVPFVHRAKIGESTLGESANQIQS